MHFIFIVSKNGSVWCELCCMYVWECMCILGVVSVVCVCVFQNSRSITRKVRLFSLMMIPFTFSEHQLFSMVTKTHFFLMIQSPPLSFLLSYLVTHCNTTNIYIGQTHC